MKEQYIASLILKERFAGLTESERSQLSSWRQESPEHERLYAHLSSKDFSEDLSRYGQIDVERGLQEYHRRYAHTTPRRRLGYRYGWVAAVVILMIGIPAFFFYKADRSVASERIEPISSKAVLVLGGGERIDLTVKEADVFEQGNASVRNNGTELQYVASDTLVKEEQVRYNELIIPKGGEFTLVLADGTKIWLNSQTKIKYPVTFAQGGRDVYLEGEAYFEVAKDKDKPFIVETQEQSIEALGTKFNVTAYPEDSLLVTTLLEGAVRLTNHTASGATVLQPDEQLIYNKNTQSMLQQRVDAAQYASWTTGYYYFPEQSLEAILYRLSHVYGVRFTVQSEALNRRMFTGTFYRGQSMKEIMEIIRLAIPIRYEIDDHHVIIAEK